MTYIQHHERNERQPKINLNDPSLFRNHEAFTMITRILSLAFFLLLISACGSLTEFRKLEKLNETTRAYEQAIRWSEFDYAMNFLKPSERETNPPDESFYKRIRVTDYKIKKNALSEDEIKAIQIAEISYYRIDNMIVKTFTDRQQWEWDAKDNRWYLTSGLPAFNQK